MNVASAEATIFFDVDDTLIFWDENYRQPFSGALPIQCPHDGMITYHRVHERHVGFLKKQAKKGYSVVVWSAAGTKWAKAVVDALNIESYVDYVTAKPVKWVDDKVDPCDVLGSRIYLDEKGHSL